MKLGSAFPDNLIIEKRKSFKASVDDGDAWWLGSGRALLFATVFCISIFILTLRLFQLTIIRGHELRALADGNRTRELVRHAPRGMIYDRTGKIISQNVAHFRLLTPCTSSSSNGCRQTISKAEGEQLKVEGLPPGSFLEVDYTRVYPYPFSLAHILGYTGEINDREMSDEYYKLHKYRVGDRIGRQGAESLFEEKLRGRDGRELVEVDASGRILRTLGQVAEIPGENVTLTLDADLSQVARDAFPPGMKGAVIVTKPTTGEILVAYSAPSFSLTDFASGLSSTAYSALVENPAQPLFNRVIGGVYPPGSTFKIVTSIAALEEGAITKDTKVEDIGVIKIGPFSFPNWYFLQYGKTEGLVDLVKALGRSNDIYFYKAGEWVGISSLAAWAGKIGIGRASGLPLGGEAIGLFPDPAWKKSHFTSAADREDRNDEWYLGDTYHVAIGQGYLLATPLQVNRWTNVIASGGKLCKPTLEKVLSSKSLVQSCDDLGIKKTNIDLIIRGMVAACATGGTGWPFFNFTVDKFVQSDQLVQLDKQSQKIQIPIACKTGTAEYGDPKNRTHAWFTAFGPVPNDYTKLASQGQALRSGENVISGEPEISVTVLVEAGGEGSYVAAPIAKEIFQAWFSR